MVLTNDMKRRREYKRLWYQKKKANEHGDVQAMKMCEDAMDKLRKVKRNPKARKKQLEKRKARYKKIYRTRQKTGFYARRNHKNRMNRIEHYRARDRHYYHNLPKERHEARLAYHREWNYKHRDLIRQRALKYERTHPDKNRKHSFTYYHRHLSKAVKEKD